MKKIKIPFPKPTLILPIILGISAISTLSHGADLSSVSQQAESILTQVLSIIKNIIRFFCIIGFIILIYRYMNNKVEWEALIKWTVGIIAIALSSEIVTALLS